MPKHKKHHYVPRLYLRNFSSDGKKLSVYVISKKSTIANVPYESQCFESYYYGIDQMWEKKLGTLETKWGVVFKKVLASNQLNQNDLYLIRQFALYQLQRTVAINEHQLKQREELLCECGRAYYERNGIIFDSKTEANLKEHAKRGYSPVEMLLVADEMTSLIQDLDLVVISYDTKYDLITSDVPVIAINPFHQPSIGYSCIGLIILFSISSKKLIVLYDKKMYTRYRGHQYVDCQDEEEVVNLNTLQYISSDKILLAESEKMFSFISDCSIEARKRNRDQDSITVLGEKDNKLIMNRPRTVMYKCPFSFGEISHRFKRIPFVCREGVPRQWDKDCEKKLDLKEQILPSILASKPELISKYDITKKELKRGFRRMSTAMKVYWSQCDNDKS